MCHGVRVGRTLLRFSFASFVLLLALSFGSIAKAATITVPAGGDLQAAINAAQPGDRIILEANKDYFCTCVLPVKSGTAFITIESSRYAEIPVRDFFSKQPAPEVVQMMARVKPFHSTEPSFQTAPGAHHYKLLGLDLSPLDGPATRVVEFGTHGPIQDTLGEVPNNLAIDKSWIHAGPTQDIQRGVSLNSASTDITNSWITECHGRGYDTQAIGGWNGSGPYKIINNYLEGAGENVMFGGADATVPNLVPTGIEFRRNYVAKPLSWYVNDPSYAGIHWTVKNLFELKNARNVLIDGNVFEGNWTDAQAGRAIAFTPRPSDSGVWAVVEDVVFQNNIVRNVGSGINLLGADEPPAPTETRLRRVKVVNNVFEVDGPRFGSNGAFATVINKTEDVTIEHNTVLQTNQIIVTDYAPNTGFIYRNNIARHNEYGVFGSGVGIGNPALEYYFPGSIFTGNLIAKEVNAPWNVELIHPAGNYFPATYTTVEFVDLASGNYRLASSSPYKGKATDGTDPGANIDTLVAALGGATPPPNPTPTPTATPTPNPNPTPTPTPSSTPTPAPTPAPSPTSRATFVQLDTTTKGNWKTTYGGDGFNTINDSTKYPAYAQVTVSGNSARTWTSSTSEVRALQKADTSDRVAARWESNSFFVVDLNLTDGQTHRVALYGLDWDGNNRVQRVDLLDWTTNSLLDSRTISSFNGGQYLVWDISGRVKIVVNKTGAKTAVLSGIYFGAGAPVSPSPTPTPTPTPSPGAPQVTLTVPTDGSRFVAGMDITLAATATDSNGSITKVDFYRSGTLIGTDTTSPYSVVWSGAQKGSYALTATATDNSGLSTTSAPVSITVTNSPNSVNRAKGHANNLVQQDYAGAGDPVVENTVLASDITSLTADIQAAYVEFKAETAAFGSTAPAIETQINAAVLFSKASLGLAMKAATSPNIKNNLLRIATHLAIAEDLMRFATIKQPTIDQANATKTRTNVIVGQANTGYGMEFMSSIAPGSIGSISGEGNAQPMLAQTVFASLSSAGSLPYEVGGLSVTVGGVAVPVLYASPFGIKFFMPVETPVGFSEIVISSQDGYICQGLVSVARVGSRIMTINDADSGSLVVVNGQKKTWNNFEVTTLDNFGTDKRTRLSFFATGVSATAFNSNASNDVSIKGNITKNFAESITVEARLSNGQVFTLPVEFAGANGGMPGLDQITVILIPELRAAGTVQLSLIIGGERSNAPTVSIN